MANKKDIKSDFFFRRVQFQTKIGGRECRRRDEGGRQAKGLIAQKGKGGCSEKKMREDDDEGV